MNFLIVNAGCRINGQGGTLSAAMVSLPSVRSSITATALLSPISTNLMSLPTKSRRFWKLMF